jgi:hypothetical protein
MNEPVQNPLGDVELGYNNYNGTSDRIPRPSTLPSGDSVYKEVDTRYEEIEAICEASETDLAEALPDLTPEQATEIRTKAQAALTAVKT